MIHMCENMLDYADLYLVHRYLGRWVLEHRSEGAVDIDWCPVCPTRLDTKTELV